MTRIIELHAENVKRLKAVRIRPSGNMVVLGGKNAMGKSSVLDAIFWALCGGKEIQRSPIRRGAKKAHVTLDLGDMKVTRRFNLSDDGTEFTTTLTVENADGFRASKPQATVEALIGRLAFDPLEFAGKAPKDQLETLRQFVADFDFAANARKRKKAFDDRTEQKRIVGAARSRAAGVVVPEAAPARIDTAELVAKLAEAGDHNAEIERRKARRQEAHTEVARFRDGAAATRRSIEAIEQQIEALRRQIVELEVREGEQLNSADALQHRIDTAEALPEPIDTAEIRASIAAAERDNAEFDARTRALAERQRWENEVTAAEACVETLTQAIAEADDEKMKAVAAAKMPIDGLGFEEDHVTLNGLPFDQASDAEQLRASIAIAMALNPRLRIIRVREGSRLDQDGMRLLGEMAEQHDYQVWVERVGTADDGAIIIEDGEVAGAQLEAAE